MWLYLPNLPNSPCAAATEDSPSLSESQSQALASSATWNAKSSSPQSWQRVWKQARWMRRLFGPTFALSTETPGAAGLISSRLASLAPRGVSPENAPAPKTTDGFGPISSASFARWDPASSSWKTCEGLFREEDCGPCSETWPISGSMRSGVVYRRPMSVRLTRESGSSFWLTPHGMAGIEADGKNGGGGEFAKQATQWRTPNTRDHHQGGPRLDHAQRQVALVDQSHQWPTPRASESENRTTSNAPSHGASHGKTLAGEACDITKTWATPMGKDGGKRSAGRRKGDDLSTQSEIWATPNARDHKGTDLPSRNGGASLSHQAETGVMSHSHRDPATGTPGAQSSPNGPISRPPSKARLNPAFVTWMMNLPEGWLLPEPTSCGRAAMALYLCRQRRRLSRWLNAQDGRWSEPSSPQRPHREPHGPPRAPTGLERVSGRGDEREKIFFAKKE